MAPGACEDRQPGSGSVLSFWGPSGRGRFRGMLVQRWAVQANWLSRHNVTGHPDCLADGDARLRVCQAVPFVALQTGQCIGQAFKCCAVGTTAVQLERLGAACGSIPYGVPSRERNRVLIWHRGLLPTDPVSGLRQKSAAGTAGEDSGLFGGVLTAETIRVSGEADSRTGAEAASRPIFGERLWNGVP